MTKDYIGGPYEVDLSELANPELADFDRLLPATGAAALLASGRSAFGVILDHLAIAGAPVLIPDYLCGEILLPRLAERNIDYRFYPVNPDLSVDEDALLALTNQDTAVVVLINYFGLCDLRALAERIRARADGVTIIVDNVQALYDRTGFEIADFLFTSFRKFCGVADGALAWGRNGLHVPVMTEPGFDDNAPYLAAAALRHVFLKNDFPVEREAAVETTYMALFAEASSRVSTEATAISDYSKRQIRRMPLAVYATRRRQNYRALANGLADINEITILTPELADDAVPLVLPTLAPTAHRDRLRAYLRERQIFCPGHWPLSDEQRDNGGPGCRELSARMIGFPIDQRYAPDQLARVTDAVSDYWKAA